MWDRSLEKSADFAGSSGQTSPKSNGLKMADFVGIFRANFPRSQSALC